MGVKRNRLSAVLAVSLFVGLFAFNLFFHSQAPYLFFMLLGIAIVTLPLKLYSRQSSEFFKSPALFSGDLKLFLILFKYQALFFVLSFLFFKINISNSSHNYLSTYFSWDDFINLFETQKLNYYWPVFIILYANIGLLLFKAAKNKFASDIAALTFLDAEHSKNRYKAKLFAYSAAAFMFFTAQIWAFFLTISIVFYTLLETIPLYFNQSSLFSWPILSSYFVFACFGLLAWRLRARKKFYAGLIQKPFKLLFFYGMGFLICLGFLSFMVPSMENIPYPLQPSKLFGYFSKPELENRWLLFMLGWMLGWLPLWSSFLGRLSLNLDTKTRPDQPEHTALKVWIYNALASLLWIGVMNTSVLNMLYGFFCQPLGLLGTGILILVLGHGIWGDLSHFRSWCAGFMPLVGPVHMHVSQKRMTSLIAAWFSVHFAWFYFFGFIADQLLFGVYVLWILPVLATLAWRYGWLSTLIKAWFKKNSNCLEKSEA
ncbi:MAG: hypothetical protein ACKOAD_06960 [Gammaproteobacteria bacterium]